MITTLEPGDIIVCTKLQTDEKSFHYIHTNLIKNT